MKRLLFTATFSCIFILFQFSVFGQPFTLVKDINVGSLNLCLSPRPQPLDLTEAGGVLFFTVSKLGNKSLWKSDGTTEGTILFKDSLNIGAMISHSGFLFFTVSNNTLGQGELWKSNGTEAGTTIVKSWPNAAVGNMVSINGTLYFILSYSGEQELWKSNGTDAGTELIKGFNTIQNLTNVAGTLFFLASDGSTFRNNIWKSNGTTAGTILVKDIYSGSGSYSISDLFDANGMLFFIGNDGINGAELWKSDGTEAGTKLVKDIELGFEGSNIRSFAVSNNILYFFAYTTSNGISFWKSDGTSGGTVMVKDLNDNSSPNYLTDVNGTLFFQGYDDTNGAELWKSDGTDAGTSVVKDIFPGTDGGYPNGSYPASFFNLNGTLFFSANNEVVPNGFGPLDCNSLGELWKSDGTEAGTVIVKDIYKGIGGSGPIGLVKLNSTIFFKANNGINGRELWKSDGTTNGTVMVKDIFTTNGSQPKKFTSFNNKIYFTAFNPDSGPAFGRGTEIYQTDGTLSGTGQSTWLFTLGGGNPREFISHNGFLYISGSDGLGYKLWKSDGVGLVSGSTKIVKELNPPYGDYDASNLTSSGPILFFAAKTTASGKELWKTDGSSDGTVLVKDINTSGNSNPSHLININGTLYFTADNGNDGIELWKSNGTEAGTVLVKNINAGGSSNPSLLTNVNGILYFAADDGINGIELWKSDGTETGTVLVKNINTGGNSSPSSLTNINGILYFAADDGVNGVEVWKSNGTDAGTVLVKDIYSGPGSSNPASFTNFNSIALFSADDGVSGRELWGSVGTAAGTILIKDIQPGPAGSNPSALTKVGNNVLFAADDGVHGSEVWLTNSSEQGTRMMSEIEAGPDGSNPTEIFEYGAKVLVAATNSMVGSEVWIADAVADIVILPEATITVNGSLAICNGGNITLKANTGNGYTYQWKKTGVNIAGAIQANYITNQSGSYTVVVTDAFGRTATSEVVVVTTGIPPLATIAAAGPLSFCAGKSVLLKAVTGNGYTYQWKKAGINIDNAVSSNYTATAAGTYSVVVTNAGGCSATSATLNVVVNAVPLTNVAAASSLTFCEGKTVQLKAITGNGYTYQWKRGGADIAGATSSNFTASTTGIYNVVITNASGCSASSAGMTVVVRPLPAALITPAGPTTFCSGKNVLLKANTGTNYTYQWIRGAAAIPGAVQSNYSATQPGLYTVIVTNSSGCSVTSAAVAINVNPLPAALITPAGPTTFCAGQNVILRGNTGTNYTYQWKKAGGDIAGATQVNYTALASGVYSVVVSNASGCPVTSAPVTVTVNNAPLASVAAAGPTTFCAGKNVLLKAISGAGYTYQWKKNGINIPQETTSNYTATAAGNYTVVVTNASGCSTTSIGIPVTVTMAPLATVAVAGPLTFCEGKNVLLKAITGTGYIYQWKKNGINIPAQTQSNFTATATGVYTVAVTNAEGCSTLSSGINVVVTPAPAAIITPNGPLTFQQGGNVVLTASTAAGNTYQWKKDGVNITGATTESYTATASGSYTVVVTNAAGCQVNSQAAVVSVTQTRPITKSFSQEEQLIKVYPNPLYQNSYLNIDWNIPETDKGVLVTVYDMSGRKINSQLLKAGDKTVKITGASGIYMVECRWGKDKRAVFRVIKIE